MGRKAPGASSMMSGAPLSLGGNPEPRAYDPASLDYQEASERFWKFLSLRTVEQMDLPRGGRVLDVACGPGASTLAAAESVGPQGRVIALDSSDQMLGMVSERASDHGLENVDVQLGDMAQLDAAPQSFDAVISVLGVFYVPDIQALVSALWRILKPGGQLAITTLGEGAFESAFGIWKSAVRAERPGAPLTFSWERTEDPDSVRALIEGAGVTNPTLRLEPREVPIPTPDDWWLAVMGTSMRRTVLEMDEEATRRVRATCDQGLRDGDVKTMRMPGIYALARKP